MAPAAVVALVMWWLVGPVLALIVVGVAAAITVAAVASPTAGRGIERAMAAVSRVVGSVLSLVVLGLLFVVVFVPVGVVSLSGPQLRPDGANRPPPGTSWLRRVDWIERRMPRRTYASEARPAGAGIPVRGRLLRLVGAVTVILLVDLAVGTFLLDTPTTGSTPGGDPAEIPALAGVPHVRPMMTEFFSARVGMYDPFLGGASPTTTGIT